MAYEREKANTRSLRRQLKSSRVLSESGEYFLPDVSITSILTLTEVEEAILEIHCEPEDRVGLAYWTFYEGKKVFAILILMSEEDHIVKFRNHGFLDTSLPLTDQDAEMIAGDVGISFADEQWEVLSETFRPKMWENHQEFGLKRILPFVDRPEQVGEGGYGEVAKVKILASQQAFQPQTSYHVHVIRKRLKSKKITREFEHEKMFLRLLNQLHHPNIIRLLGSYTHREEHYFLFPCIDMDLKHFFMQQDRIGEFQQDLTFYSALRGLSSALCNAHSLRLNQEAHGVDFEAIGYHHDIRPENILVSQSTFILADFGVANLKPVDAASPTSFKPGAGDYLAPEFGLGRQDLTRAVDVWAFGCLVADTATYMSLGSKGVAEFSNRRFLPTQRRGWKDTVFYGQDGEVKNEVKEWLRSLTSGNADGAPISSLVDIALHALIKDPQDRPRIKTLCESLTSLSVRAHYVATINGFAKFMESVSSDMNNIWVLQQRLQAWGRSLALDNTSMSTELTAVLEGIHDESTRTMANICRIFEPGRNIGGTDTRESANTGHIFENEADQLIESLWACLPTNLQRHATDYWHQSILCTTNTSDLAQVGHTLRLRYGVHSVIHAMAVMRKMRLDMLSPDSLQGVGEACKISMSEIELYLKEGSHTLGRYHGNSVLVEWTQHPPTQVNTSPEQRELVISLKVKCLNLDSKPRGLRTLDCIGSTEHDDASKGYGLVYRFPDGEESATSTLLHLLEKQSAKPGEQPALGDKFRLAFSLADFLKEFHTIGWLHENFNSHNVLFFHQHDESSTIYSQAPFVMGLQKSRPDGSFWETEGPDLDAHLQDYQHPDYVSYGQRYRFAFDYYSLGIVLLEIGLWRPLKSWQTKFRDLSMAEVRSQLIEICQERLGMRMGVVYKDVVLRCMDGSLESSACGTGLVGNDRLGSEDEATKLRRFTEKVVEPLAKLAEASI
ncbi:hypothetical protein Hte_009100 [Hypoxylon texense]